MIGLMSPVDKQKETRKERGEKLQTHFKYFEEEIVKNYLIAKTIDKRIARYCLRPSCDFSLDQIVYFSFHGFTPEGKEWFAIAITLAENPQSPWPFQILVDCGENPGQLASRYVGSWEANIEELTGSMAIFNLKSKCGNKFDIIALPFERSLKNLRTTTQAEWKENITLVRCEIQKVFGHIKSFLPLIFLIQNK